MGPQKANILGILFAVLALVVESRLTMEKYKKFTEEFESKDDNQATKWAVLVAGSNEYYNYRHQADICHAYQILKKGGLKDENIIVFMYDDIAFNEENPRQGIIINHPKGHDVYEGVPKDYTGKNLTVENLLAVILGNEKKVKGGSGKVVKSGPKDHIFIYYADHGGPGVLGMPGEKMLYAHELIRMLKKKHASGTYKNMVIYVEACESGSMFDGLLPEGMNIYVTTASNPNESSWATYCPGDHPAPPKDFTTCLGDMYSVSWMEDSDKHDSKMETLHQQYKSVKKRTRIGEDQEGSHVMQYGDIGLSRDTLSVYTGTNDYNKTTVKPTAQKEIKVAHETEHFEYSSVPLQAVDQRDVHILYLLEKIRRSNDIEKEAAKKELEAAIKHRKHIDQSVREIGDQLFGVEKSDAMLKMVRPFGQPLVDDWPCLKSLVHTYERQCGRLSTYGKKYMRAFANMCNVGFRQDHIAKAATRVCKKM